MKHHNNAVVLDKIDLKIISALYRDGRMTKLQLAEEVGLSATPCWERMKKLEQNGIIKGYHAELDLKKIMPISATRVEITLKNYSLATAAEFEKVICQMPEVVECEAVLGNIDYILKILSRNVEDYQRIIESLLSSLSMEVEHKTLPVSKTIKQGYHSNLQQVVTSYLAE